MNVDEQLEDNILFNGKKLHELQNLVLHISCCSILLWRDSTFSNRNDSQFFWLFEAHAVKAEKIISFVQTRDQHYMYIA